MGLTNTLQNVDNLRIEWINTLNLRLQLDVRERILRSRSSLGCCTKVIMISHRQRMMASQ